MRFFVGIHSITNDPTGMAIRAATEAWCKPPWVMGAAHPASHAFVAWIHPDGLGYRLDAAPGGARLLRWNGPQGAQVAKSAFWEVLPISGIAPSVGWDRAVELVGAPYDALEFLGQVIPGLQNMPGVKGAFICTNLVCSVLEAAGAKAFVAGLKDRFPERLGRALEDFQAGKPGLPPPWAVRV